MTESTREQFLLLNSLLKVTHRDLMQYVDDVLPGADQDPMLFAHLMAWNEKNGRIRDTKVAYPVLALRTRAADDDELAENAVAHMVSQGPRELVRAYRFNKQLSAAGQNIRKGRRRMIEKALRRYLEVREKNRGWWDGAVVRNREAMKEIYAVSHKKPAPFAQKVLFDEKYPGGSVFEKIAKLGSMEPLQAAAVVLKHKIPITVATGAGVKLDDPGVLIALVQSMTGNELVVAAKSLSKLKSFSMGAVQDAYREAVGKVSTDKRVGVSRAKRAAEAAPEAKKALDKLQDKAAESVGKIKGDWLILADRSPSMSAAIDAGKEMAALIANRVEGKVYLCFFDARPVFYDVTGASVSRIQEATRHIREGSSTSCGCGLRYIREKGVTVDGIVAITDGEENTAPYFVYEYQKLGYEPTIFFVEMAGYYGNNVMKYGLDQAQIPYQHFDLRRSYDAYALENVVKVLKPGTYGLLDEVLSTPLLTLDTVLEGKEVKRNVLATTT